MNDPDPPPRILVSNDDGYMADGLQALVKAVEDLGEVWVAAPEAGVFRTFHDERLVAWLEFLETFFTPAEVEGLTLEKIRFARRGEREYAKLTDLPPRLFSGRRHRQAGKPTRPGHLHAR